MKIYPSQMPTKSGDDFLNTPAQSAMRARLISYHFENRIRSRYIKFDRGISVIWSKRSGATYVHRSGKATVITKRSSQSALPDRP